MKRRNRVQIEVVSSEMSDYLTKLEEAVLRGDVNTTKDLLSQNKVDGSQRFTQGDTLLHLAVRSADPAMVNFIIDNVKDIDFQAQNRRANTPLCLAVQLARPNTQTHTPEQRKDIKPKYEKICLMLIEADKNVSITSTIKNLMRKSALDYLNKVVRIPSVQDALDKKTIIEISKQANISPQAKNKIKRVNSDTQFISFRSTTKTNTPALGG